MKKILKNKKLLIIIIIALLLVIAVPTTYFILKENNNNTKKDIKKELTVEAFQKNITFEVGDEFDLSKILSDAFKDNKNLTVKLTIKDAEGNIKEVALAVKYFNSEGNEVSKEEAIQIIDEKETLKEIYISKEYITEFGEYTLTIVDQETKKEYDTVITIKDTTVPILTLKDVTITEGDEVTINSFIESCTDNSRKDCILILVKEDGSIEEQVPNTVGEHTIRIIAKDISDNKTEIQSAKLTINKKTTTSSNNSSKNNGSVSGSDSTTNKSGTDASNPIAQAALALVGNANLSCAQVAEKAVNAVGKSFYAYGDYYGTRFNFEKWYVRNGVSQLFTDHTYTMSYGSSSDYDLGVSAETNVVFYISNNIIQGTDVTGCYWKENNLCHNGSNYDKYIGQEFYVYQHYWNMSTDSVIAISTQVSLANVKAGDILLYDDGGNGYSHVAVYVGNGKAVHGGFNGYNVVVASMYPNKNASIPTAWRVNY